MESVPAVTLNNGVVMPALGFGVFQIPDPEECERSVLAALEAGYRLIDTAAAYGNEEAVGNAVKASGVPREEIFLVTKLWVTDADEEKTPAAFERSLQRLGVDYVDLYLIHQPFGDYYGAWRAMESFVTEGRARAIGVSNFLPDRLMDLAIHSQITPAINQIEIHPHHQQHAALNLMQELGVQPMAWAPFAENLNNLFDEQVLGGIATRHGKSVQQVILRWSYQRGVIAIPKSVRPERIRQNIDIFDFELSDADMAAIQDLDRGQSSFFDHRDPETVKRIAGLPRAT